VPVIDAREHPTGDAASCAPAERAA
jgi:hypothetical protein